MKRTPIGRSIDGVVFGLKTPLRHANSGAKSNEFLREAGLERLDATVHPPTKPRRYSGTRKNLIIVDDL